MGIPLVNWSRRIKNNRVVAVNSCLSMSNWEQRCSVRVLVPSASEPIRTWKPDCFLSQKKVWRNEELDGWWEVVAGPNSPQLISTSVWYTLTQSFKSLLLFTLYRNTDYVKTYFVLFRKLSHVMSTIRVFPLERRLNHI